MRRRARDLRRRGAQDVESLMMKDMDRYCATMGSGRIRDCRPSVALEAACVMYRAVVLETKCSETPLHSKKEPNNVFNIIIGEAGKFDIGNVLRNGSYCHNARLWNREKRPLSHGQPLTAQIRVAHGSFAHLRQTRSQRESGWKHRHQSTAITFPRGREPNRNWAALVLLLRQRRSKRPEPVR